MVEFFQESDIVVVRGSIVRWINDGRESHSAASTQGGDRWDTDLLRPGQRGQHIFSTPGLFFYFCKIHPFVTASIRVLE